MMLPMPVTYTNTIPLLDMVSSLLVVVWLLLVSRPKPPLLLDGNYRFLSSILEAVTYRYFW
jgi:hypothetical protein